MKGVYIMGNDNIIIEKYKKFAHFLNIAMKIFLKIAMIIAGLTVIIGLVIFFLPKEIFTSFNTGSDSYFNLTMDGMLTYRLSLDKSVNAKPVINIIVFAVSMISTLLAIIFHQIHHILNTVEIDKPFERNNSKRITTIGGVLIIWAFLVRAVEFAVYYVAIETYNIKDLSISYKSDTNMILIGFLLMVLAGVFKYGSYLQEEYDTTI